MSNKREYDPNLTYTTYHTPLTNVPMVPQMSGRPTTLPINTQLGHNPLLFTPSDQDKFGLSTPDLINALAAQPYPDAEPSPTTKALEEFFNHRSTMVNPHLMMPSMQPFHHNIPPLVSNTANPHQEILSSSRTNRTDSQISSIRDRSVSSSMNDNDSSNSTDASSPVGSYLHSSHVKDELQHVPSVYPGEPNESIRKEKKRERNRQAAQKCRTRKLTRIAELQKRVNDLQGKNRNLTGIAESLKTDINKLEKQLQDHHTQGCTLMNGSVL